MGEVMWRYSDNAKGYEILDPKRESVFCDDCLTVAYDYVGVGYEKQVRFLEAMDMSSLEDHLCGRIETDGEEKCDCDAHGR
jgi:hypothetical protein